MLKKQSIWILSTTCIVTSIIIGILISQKIILWTEIPKSQSWWILLPWEDICLWKDRALCLQKINDRLRFMNDITAMSNLIETKSWKTIATINFPAFSDRTKEEKDEIIKKIQKSNIQILAIGIASKEPTYIQELKNILPQIKFNELHIQIYSEPENIIELFDTIVWKKNENMKLSLEFIQTDLPKKINLFNYIYMAEKMIQRNNSNTPIASFSIEFNPLFGEFQDFDRYVLYPEEWWVFNTLSTKELYIVGMHTTYKNKTNGEYEDQKGRTFNFLKNNPIQTIFINSIAQKQNWTITLTWF